MVSFSKEIVTFALTGVKYGRRHKTIVSYFKKSLNKHGSHSFTLTKYFYLFFTAVSARLKHNLRLLFQRIRCTKKKRDDYYCDCFRIGCKSIIKSRIVFGVVTSHS